MADELSAIEEKDDEIVVKASLPGIEPTEVKAEDVETRVEDGSVVVRVPKPKGS